MGVIKAAACIVQMEKRLEVGDLIDDLLASDVAHMDQGLLARRIPEEDENLSSYSASPATSPTTTSPPTLCTVEEDTCTTSPPLSPLPHNIPLCQKETCRRCRRMRARLPHGHRPSLLDVFNAEDSAASSTNA